MSKSNRVTLEEAERLLNLAVTLARTPATGKERAIIAMQEMAKLVGARAGSFVRWGRRRNVPADLPAQQAYETLDGALLGVESTADARERLAHYFETLEPADPVFDVVLQSAEPVATLPRQTLLSRQEWVNHPHYYDLRRHVGIDDAITTRLATDQVDQLLTICLHRAVGDKVFTPRQWKLVELFFRQAWPLFVDNEDPRLARLTPRQREVLGHLLAGEAYKQIARSLNLSLHTVNEYVKAIYRRFNVSGRGELAALLLRHR